MELGSVGRHAKRAGVKRYHRGQQESLALRNTGYGSENFVDKDRQERRSQDTNRDPIR